MNKKHSLQNGILCSSNNLLKMQVTGVSMEKLLTYHLKKGETTLKLSITKEQLNDL